MKPHASIDCASGFDPFTDRGPSFEAHLHACPACADVVRVLSRATFVWRDASAGDAARGVFRERRLASGRGRAPVRTTVVTAIVFLAIGVTTAWGLGRLPLPWRAAPVAESPQPVLAPLPRVAAPVSSAALPACEEPTLVPTAPASAAPPVAPARPVAAAGASELWKLGIARLEQGDRPAAGRFFQRVIDAPDVDPELRDRATFRLAQVRLAMGDAVTPRDALFRLVRGRDRALGFDAALLLERCVPDDRVSVWDAFLATAPDEPLRSQALARRAAAMTTESQGSDPSR